MMHKTAAIDIHCQGGQNYLAVWKLLSDSQSWPATLLWYSPNSLERDDKNLHVLQQ